MYSTGKFVKRVGIEPNTMVVWQREMIIIPEVTEGRNNLFSEESVTIGKCLAPLYKEWGLGTKALRGVADVMRSYLLQRKKAGYDDPLEFMKANGTATVASFINDCLNNNDPTYDNWTKDARILARLVHADLPEDWNGEAIETPILDKGRAVERIYYSALMAPSLGMKSLHNVTLFVAHNGAGEWHTKIAFGESPKFEWNDANSYIAINLTKVLTNGDVS